MKPYCLYLYRCLLQELDSIHRLPTGEAEKAEKSFHRCVHYWLRLVKRVKGRSFRSPIDEVHFYKEFKPMFTSETEYYSLLYHVALFKPLDSAFLKSFWLKELDRVEQLLIKVPSFYTYYCSGRTDQDPQFFNRANGSLNLFMIEWKHVVSCTHYDLLISQYRALEKFKKYIDEQLQVLDRQLADS